MKKLFFAVLLITTITSCKDKDKDQPENPTYGDIKIKFEHFWGHSHSGHEAEAFQLNTNLVTETAGDTVSFSKLKYYISNVQFTDVSGTVVAESESYHLVDFSSKNPFELIIEDIPTGEYVAVNFTIGVDSVRNVSGAQEGALSPSNEMFWSWNTGYRFIVAEGQCVTSTGNQDFTYHLGGFSGSNNAINVVDFAFGESLTTNPTATPSLHFNVNVQSFWNSNFNLKDNKMIHMPGTKAVNAANNFAGGFELNHVHK